MLKLNINLKTIFGTDLPHWRVFYKLGCFINEAKEKHNRKKLPMEYVSSLLCWCSRWSKGYSQSNWNQLFTLFFRCAWLGIASQGDDVRLSQLSQGLGQGRCRKGRNIGIRVGDNQGTITRLRWINIHLGNDRRWAQTGIGTASTRRCRSRVSGVFI